MTDHYTTACEAYDRLMSTPLSPISLICVEDEMLTFHRDGKYLTTLYADCPEQANDFFKSRSKQKLATTEEWTLALDNFAMNWKTKYEDES